MKLRIINKVGLNSIKTYVVLLLIVFSGCESTLDEQVYKGQPYSLRYVNVSDYNIGEGYVSLQPSVMGGQNAAFSIVGLRGPVSQDILLESFEVAPDKGNVVIKEYNRLNQGEYCLDIEVRNNLGSKVFKDAFKVTATQVEPYDLRFVPSLYSIYGDELGDVSSLPLVKGGGPYHFSLQGQQEYFQIDSITGVISFAKDYAISDNQKVEKQFFVTVRNNMGTTVAQKPCRIEIVGKNIGKLAYNMELTTADAFQKGLLNVTNHTIIGPFSTTVNDEDYETKLVDGINSPVWKGNRYRNCFHSYAGYQIIRDVTGAGEITKPNCLGFKTNVNTVECVAFVVSDSINLEKASASATVEIEGFKRFLDNDINQNLRLAICEESNYDKENVNESEWTYLSNNIAPDLYMASKTKFKESDLINEGSQVFDLPTEYLGKKIRIALVAVHLNTSLGKVGREYYITRWQVRYK